MPTRLTVRNLDEELIRRLKIRAAQHGRSAEAEHREILRQALNEDPADFWELAPPPARGDGGEAAHARGRFDARGPRRAVTAPGTPVVGDASVALQWVAPEPTSDLAARLRSRALAAPDLLAVECSNALWKKVGRGEFTVAEARQAAVGLTAAPIRFTATRPYMERAVLIAAELGHLANDRFYLALAERLDTVCVSADRRLARVVVTRASARYADLLVALADVDRLPGRPAATEEAPPRLSAEAAPRAAQRR